MHTLLPDWAILRRIQQQNMIKNAWLDPSPEGEISSGISSYGYDARLSDQFKVCSGLKTGYMDPKQFNPDLWVDEKADVLIIPPHGFALGKTVEYFKIPRDILVICLGKSTYARCGIIVNVTPLEPEWEGNVTIEISNTTPVPAKVYAFEGICQFLFLKAARLKSEQPQWGNCALSYADKKGKYQGHTEITPARV